MKTAVATKIWPDGTPLGMTSCRYFSLSCIFSQGSCLLSRYLTTQLAKNPVVTTVAVGLVRFLLEGAALELLPAVGAHEALRMELPAHGRDATTHCVGESPSP